MRELKPQYWFSHFLLPVIDLHLPDLKQGGHMQVYNNNTENLMNKLPQFGLNPNDWNILKINSKNYVLKHRQDEDLCLLGKVEDEESYNWQDLQWLSL